MTVEAFCCIKNTIRLRSGRYFDFQNPQPDQFTLSDIGGALSKICRFGGQINSFYSVAEHLVNCSNQARKDRLTDSECLACFLHDAHEAFIGDVVKPLKIMLGGTFSHLEQRIDDVVQVKFGVDFERNYEAIKKIDREMLIAERRHFFTPDKVEWHGESEVRKLDRVFAGYLPTMAETWFKDIAERNYGLKYDE